MSLLDDVTKFLDRWDVWQKIRNASDRVPILEERIAELEQKLAGKSPAEVSKFCGDRTARLSRTLGPNAGLIEQKWSCASCSKTETRVVKPSP